MGSAAMPSRSDPTLVRNATYVLPEVKLLYVANPKAACTALVRLMMDIAGVELTDPARSTAPETSVEMLVHDRSLVPIPKWPDRDDEQLAILGPGWMRFGVTRNPFARAFSAWIDKVLLSHPPTVARFGQQQLSVDGDSGQINVSESYRKFLDDLCERRHAYFEDRHFGLQTDNLRQDVFAFNDLVDVGEMSHLLSRIGRHLQEYRIAVPPFRRLNESLRLPWQKACDDAVLRRLSVLYADDFEAFGYPREPCSEFSQDLILSSESSNLIRQVRARSERFALLLAEAKRRSGGRYATHEVLRYLRRSVRRGHR